MLKIDPTARISPLADIEPSVRGTLFSIGANSMVDAFVKFKPAGGNGPIEIGNGTYINSGCVIYSGHGVKIGDHVLIAANCTLAAVNHAFERRDVLIRDQGFQRSRGGILIEDDVWVGANSVLLDGTLLRRGAVIGAGSVVRHEVPEYSISVGSPAKVVGWRQ